MSCDLNTLIPTNNEIDIVINEITTDLSKSPFPALIEDANAEL